MGDDMVSDSCLGEHHEIHGHRSVGELDLCREESRCGFADRCDPPRDGDTHRLPILDGHRDKPHIVRIDRVLVFGPADVEVGVLGR